MSVRSPDGPVTDPYAAVQCCERVTDATADGDLSAARRRLRELADLLAGDELAEPAFDDVRADAAALADRVAEHARTAEDLALESAAAFPASLREEVNALAHRVCRCYLRAADIDPTSLPDATAGDTDELVAAIEAAAEQRDELEATTVLWAARAKALAAERTAAQEALEGVMDAVAELDTDRSRLEASREALKEAAEREREARERRKRIEERSRQLSGGDGGDEG